MPLHSSHLKRGSAWFPHLYVARSHSREHPHAMFTTAVVIRPEMREEPSCIRGFLCFNSQQGCCIRESPVTRCASLQQLCRIAPSASSMQCMLHNSHFIAFKCLVAKYPPGRRRVVQNYTKGLQTTPTFLQHAHKRDSSQSQHQRMQHTHSITRSNSKSTTKPFRGEVCRKACLSIIAEALQTSCLQISMNEPARRPVPLCYQYCALPRTHGWHNSRMVCTCCRLTCNVSDTSMHETHASVHKAHAFYLLERETGPSPCC
jgi:hypothetical protein